MTPSEKMRFFGLSLAYVDQIKKLDIRGLRKTMQTLRELVAQVKDGGVSIDRLGHLLHGVEWKRRMPEDNFMQEIYSLYHNAEILGCSVCGRTCGDPIQWNHICEGCNVALEGYGK